MEKTELNLGIDFIKEMMKIYEEEFGVVGIAKLLKDSLGDLNTLSNTICEMLGRYVPTEIIQTHFKKLNQLSSEQIDEVLLKVANTYVEFGHLGYPVTFQAVANL